MAKNVFDPSKRYRVTLFGHGFDMILTPPMLPGHFEADTVEVEAPPRYEKEYAVFHVEEPQNGIYPPGWVGVYRIPMGFLRRNPPQVLP